MLSAAAEASEAIHGIIVEVRDDDLKREPYNPAKRLWIYYSLASGLFCAIGNTLLGKIELH